MDTDNTPPTPAPDPEPSQAPPSPAPEPRPKPGPRDNSFFAAIRNLGIVRTQERWVGGVAGGLAKKFGWDPLLVRGIFLASFFLLGFGLALYGAAWALLPEERDGRIHLQEAIRGDFNVALVGAGICVLASGGSWWGLNFGTGRSSSPLFSWLSPWSNRHWMGPLGWIFTLAKIAMVITIAVLVITYLAKRRPPTDPPAAAASASDSASNTNSATASDTALDGAALDGAWDLAPDHASSTDTAPIVLPAAAAQPAEASSVTADSPAPTATGPSAAAAATPAASTTPDADRWEQRRAYGQQKAAQRAAELARTPQVKAPGASTVGLILGLIALVGAFILGVNNGHLSGPHWMSGNISAAFVWIGASTVLLGAGIVVAALRGRKSGALGTLAIITLSLTLPFAGLVSVVDRDTVIFPHDANVTVFSGHGVHRPSSHATASNGYVVVAGETVVDLTSLDFSQVEAGQPLVVPVSVMAGSMEVRVPPGIGVETVNTVVAGELRNLLPGFGSSFRSSGPSNWISSSQANDIAHDDGVVLQLNITVIAGLITVLEYHS